MRSYFFIFVQVLLLSSCWLANGSIRVKVDIDEVPSMSYSVVNAQNATLFSGGDLAVFVGGRWCVAPSPTLSLRLLSWADGSRKPISMTYVQHEPISGTTPGLGAFEGIQIRWSCNFQDNPEKNELLEDGNPLKNKDIPIITSFLNFESERAIGFDLEYPEGAEETSLVRFNQSDGDTATLATFPSFFMDQSSIHTSTEDEKNDPTQAIKSFFPPTFPSALSWEGSFVQSVRGLSHGPRGGPTVFYNASDLALSNVVVASPFYDLFQNNKTTQTSRKGFRFNEFTSGNHKDWTGTKASFSPGKSGRLTSLPPGSSQSILLYEGSRGGITSTLNEWGNILQTASAALATDNYTASKVSTTNKKRQKLKDVTLEQIGYQTDNGAMYCFCRNKNCSEVLLEEKAYLDSIGIPIGYLSFQGAGTSSGRGKAAPWCVEQWSADGGQDRNNYPLDTKDFQAALGVPLQLYAPYFCPNATRYFAPGDPWERVSSNTDLPGCSAYAFDTVRAEDSGAFFHWFLTKGVENGGMVSFESDFMNQNVNCVDDFVENSGGGGADEYLEGMAGAAHDLGVPIQWCYASPNVVMASLDFPAVTNFRVSFDYCYGKSYEIGESSLLVWAVGAHPSKDTLWTTDNNRTETPGCDWTVDHETIAAELHVVLAIMSTGPVGISDAIGMTNATLLKRIISGDGSLLQPSKPITAIDSSFLEVSKPDGFIYGTHGLELSWIFVSFQLRDSFPVTSKDFWPPISFTNHSSADTYLVYRSFASSRECVDGANAVSSGCVTLVSLQAGSNGDNDPTPVFITPTSSFDSPGSDLSPSIITVWQKCPGSGIFFLGELDKYVALSPKRFISLDCSEDGLSVTLLGSVGEVVEITLLNPQSDSYQVVKQNITISDPKGFFRFYYQTNATVVDSKIEIE